MSLQFACFVTGTDTGVGKTLVSAALLRALVRHGWRAVGMKPVASGAELIAGRLVNDDAEQLAAAGNLQLPRTLTTPYLFREPTAPHLAAQLEGVTIAAATIIDCYRQLTEQAQAVVVEGVGGFVVPLSDGFDTADLATELGLPVVLVVGVRLGCLNHAQLTAQAIKARGLRLAGWVANRIDPQMAFCEETIATLSALLPAPLLGVIPHLAVVDADAASRQLDLGPLLGVRLRTN